MATAWFLCGFDQRVTHVPPYFMRYCRMDEFWPDISAAGGTWDYTEVLGGYAVCKVRASDTVLQTIANAAGFFRVPVARLSDTLGSLNQQTIINIRDRVLAMGYTQEEVSAALPANWRQITLRQLLHFVSSRRRRLRLDRIQNTYSLDGEITICSPTIEEVDINVPE